MITTLIGIFLASSALMIILSMFRSEPEVNEYTLFGPGGADEYERQQLGMTEEEYKDYNKNV